MKQLFFFNSIMSIEHFENKNKTVDSLNTKTKNVIKKHEALWQEIWPRHNKEDFENLKNFRGARLDANGINDFIKNKVCVDFGCGNGNFSFALLDKVQDQCMELILVKKVLIMQVK